MECRAPHCAERADGVTRMGGGLPRPTDDGGKTGLGCNPAPSGESAQAPGIPATVTDHSERHSDPTDRVGQALENAPRRGSFLAGCELPIGTPSSHPPTANGEGPKLDVLRVL